jgi:lipoprotein-anchoring transpeptidase ErfK/SrfK
MNLNAVFKILPPLICILYSCQGQKAEEIKTNENPLHDAILKNDTSTAADSAATILTELNINYKLHKLNDSILNEFKDTYSDSAWKIICAINRIDPNRLHRADSIVIPDTITADIMDYSPFPKIISQSAYNNKIIFVSYSIQAFALYRNDSLIRWGPVSMGAKKTTTPTGLYHTNWKSKRQISSEDSTWILNWYFNINNLTGVSFHEYDLPGFPASHSCIRMRKEDAEFLYYFAQQWKLNETGREVITQGTPVIIFGTYPWGKTRPWFHLSRDNHFLDISKDSLEALLKQKTPNP